MRYIKFYVLLLTGLNQLILSGSQSTFAVTCHERSIWIATPTIAIPQLPDEFQWFITFNNGSGDILLLTIAIDKYAKDTVTYADNIRERYGFSVNLRSQRHGNKTAAHFQTKLQFPRLPGISGYTFILASNTTTLRTNNAESEPCAVNVPSDCENLWCFCLKNYSETCNDNHNESLPGKEQNLPQPTIESTPAKEQTEAWQSQAPEVSVAGNLTGIEGNVFEFNCKYEEKDNSSEKMTRFYFNNTEYKVAKNIPFRIVLNKTDNGKNISCQRFMKRSESKIVNVLYKPYRNETEPCKMTKNSNSSCKISIFTNPKTTILRLIKTSCLGKSTAVKHGIKIKELDYDEKNFRQTFLLFPSKPAEEEDQGNYALMVGSTVPPFLHLIDFEISFSNFQNQKDIYWPLGVVVAIILSILLAFVLFFKKYKK